MEGLGVAQEADDAADAPKTISDQGTLQIMTTLIAWVGADSRGHASLYLASDSRITWPGGQRWDMGTKLFSCPGRPEIFGFCGDVVFPTQILPKICQQLEMLDAFSEGASFNEKLNWVSNAIEQALSEYPTAMKVPFQIIYASRVGEGMAATFHVGVVSLTSNGKLATDLCAVPVESGLIEKAGSGEFSVSDWYSRWQRSDVARTSRAVFGAFCDSLNSSEDPSSGGAPQLLGLYRKGPPRVFGVVWKGKRYRLGRQSPSNDTESNVEWRNCNFERCDPYTLDVIEGAQKQPRPVIPGRS